MSRERRKVTAIGYRRGLTGICVLVDVVCYERDIESYEANSLLVEERSVVDGEASDPMIY